MCARLIHNQSRPERLKEGTVSFASGKDPNDLRGCHPIVSVVVGPVIDADLQGHILRYMKTSSVPSFVSGLAAILGFAALAESNSSHHVYELRLYHVNPGQMDALKARFGNHTDAIFKRHNMKSIGYWVPEDQPHSQNLFVYILEHPSREEAKDNWAAFQNDPERKKVKADSESQGPLVAHIDNYLIDPLNFGSE